MNYDSTMPAENVLLPLLAMLLPAESSEVAGISFPVALTPLTNFSELFVCLFESIQCFVQLLSLRVFFFILKLWNTP